MQKPPKEISQKQLVRIFKDIKELNTEENRFCFLIGAGASKSSGIPTGLELAKKWDLVLKEDLEEEYDKWKIEVGFEDDRIGEFYPQLYQKRYESSPKLGYEEFKQLMEDKEPSIGYVILSQILANEKHNFVITTNFDYLIEDAVRMFTATKPFSAGHETLARFISTQTERPTIIKVHRDLFLHPFNDKVSTESLMESWKVALRPLLRDFNLLVIGYGGNDGSLMDYLKEIKSEDRNPIYWCKRKDDKLNARIEKLLTPDDYIVIITGFDELMYALYGALGYNTFDQLGNPEQHQFVKNAKKRTTKLYNKLAKLILKDSLERSKKQRSNKNDSNDVRSLFTGALEYIFRVNMEQNIDKKETIFLDGIQEYPVDVILINYYADFLYNSRNDYDQAEEFYKKNIELDPEDGNSFSSYAVFLSDIRNKYDKAEEYYKKGIELDPEDGNSFGSYALFLKDIRNNYDKAEEYFKKAIELGSENASNFGNYAIFLSDIRKEYDKAEEIYKKVMELDSENIYTISNYAHLLLISKKDFKTAKIYIDNAFKLPNINLSILSELWFYRYAHYSEYFKQGEIELEKLIKQGAKSIGWNLQEHVEIAKQNSHPNVDKLQYFADMITKIK